MTWLDFIDELEKKTTQRVRWISWAANLVLIVAIILIGKYLVS